MNRRKFLKRAALAAGLLGGVPAYGRFEAERIGVTRLTTAVPRLPDSFAGTTVALLADLHHGPWTSLDFIRDVVVRTNALQPDLIALVGDYIDRLPSVYLDPCTDVLRDLRAPLGVYAVPGNHDRHTSLTIFGRSLRAAGLTDATNTGHWLEKDGRRLRLAGVDDLWNGEPDLSVALGDATAADACLLLCHNPDYVEEIEDRRVGLVLSGHTHGGQIYLPVLGAPWAPTQFGSKYLYGLVRTEVTQVFVSRGLGTVGVPFRLNCPPEIALLTLTPA